MPKRAGGMIANIAMLARIADEGLNADELGALGFMLDALALKAPAELAAPIETVRKYVDEQAAAKKAPAANTNS